MLVKWHSPSNNVRVTFASNSQGSAAACRGSISAPTADALASFFVELAWKGKAVVPFTKQTKRGNGQIDLLVCSSDTSTSISASLSAVAAFGSMLREDRRPLWKQRLTHNTLNSLQPAMTSFHENTVNSTGDTLGLVAVVCHLICASNLKSISLSKKGEMVRILVSSLTSGPSYGIGSAPGSEQQLVGEVKRLAIAALLRLSASNTGLVSFKENMSVATNWSNANSLCCHSCQATLNQL